MKKFGLPYSIEEIPSKGSWVLNTCQKPFFIRRKLLELKKPIIWLDADAIVKKYPIYFDFIQEDFGIHCENLEKPQTGTIFFRYNDIVLEFLDKWEINCKKFPERGSDQPNIAGIIRGFCFESYRMSFFWLPKAYCQIFDIRNDDNVVIEHYQASRKFRGGVG